MEAAPADMAAEGAEEVDEGTQKIGEEDLCGFAALVMMPLDRRWDASPLGNTYIKSSILHNSFFIHERFIYEP